MLLLLELALITNINSYTINKLLKSTVFSFRFAIKTIEKILINRMYHPSAVLIFFHFWIIYFSTYEMFYAKTFIKIKSSQRSFDSLYF